MKERLFRIVKSNVFCLCLIYLISHIFLCIVSGIWWDDWVYWTVSDMEVKERFWTAGAPWEAYNLFSVMWIPNGGYRIVVFVEFLIGGILFYKILSSLDLFTEKDALWIAAIYMTVPVNDARTTLICYGYSLSLCLFMISFFIITRNRDKGSKFYVLLRIVSILCLLYSYTTESLLVFTGVIWLYQLYRLSKEENTKRIMKLIKNCIRENLDYIILPFAFFIIRNIFFKPYGNYEGRNSVTLTSLLKGIMLSPTAAVGTLGGIAYNYFKQISIISMLVIVVCMFIWFIAAGRKDAEDKLLVDARHNLSMFLLGAIVYFAGIFPYIVVRGNWYGIVSSGVGGRDSMLAGFGIAISAWAFVRLVRFPEILKKTIFISMVVLGIFHFNNWYLNYQEDWYHQLEFSHALSVNEELVENDKTVLCNFSHPSPNGGRRFYSLNGMSYEITGKMDKFYFSSISDLRYGVDYNEYFSNGYNADDYDYSDRSIDSVLLINNQPIKNIDLIRLRFKELFDYDSFMDEILDMTDITYVKVSEDISDKIYASYKDGTLDSDSLHQIIGVEK